MSIYGNSPPGVGWRRIELATEGGQPRKLWIPPPVEHELKPHPLAPLYQGDDRKLLFDQALSEITSTNLHATDDLKDLLRQTCLVNLWFFLKGVASFSGPYDKLTDHLHVEMTNYYQKEMYPGSRAGGFIFRSGYKSTVWDSGANSWEVLRNPNIRMSIVSGVIERAMEWLAISQRTFDNNDLMEWLFPEYYVKKPSSQPRWNANEMVTPARSREFVEPSIKIMGAFGSTAGVHCDLLKADDIVSDKQLTAMQEASAEMIKAGQWLMSNMNTLLMSPIESRVFVIGTRYAINDPYEKIFENMKTFDGPDQMIPHKPIDKGIWDVYYRMVVQDDLEVFPESVSKEYLETMDEWTKLTQYYNNPYLFNKGEINNYGFQGCSIDMKDELVRYKDHLGQEKEVRLRDLYIIQVTDPAATAGGVATRRHSRSAHMVIGQDQDGRYFVLWGNVGHKEILTVFDWLFKAKAIFGKWLRRSGMEMQGPFKLLGPLIFKEQKKRHESLGFYGIKTQGDKDTRIRGYLEMPLSESKIYVVDGMFKDEIEKELEVFPGGAQKDCLDVLAMGIQESRKPKVLKWSGVDWFDETEVKAQRDGGSGRCRVTGY